MKALADSGVFHRRLAPKNIKIARPTLFNYIYTREEFDQYTTELFTLMTEKNLNVKIWDTYPLKDVARAHNVSTPPPKVFLRIPSQDHQANTHSTAGSRNQKNNGQTPPRPLTHSVTQKPK